jgi:hypothetical protein
MKKGTYRLIIIIALILVILGSLVPLLSVSY